MNFLQTDVLVIGAGGAGMYAAITAAETGVSILLLDKSVVGRSGATIMAQMTVAAAIDEPEQDHWGFHLADTITAGRGLVDEPLARILCQSAPDRIRQMDDWGVG
ncbi:MAG: FAD-binding protein, partial [Alphaproteobacteria bacterium]